MYSHPKFWVHMELTYPMEASVTVNGNRKQNGW